MNILITGACGVTSRSVLRSLKQSSVFWDATFIGTDTCENTYGLYEKLYTKIYKVPRFDAPDYIKIISDIIIREEIEVAIIISELEVLEWAKHRFPTKYVVPPLEFCQHSINKATLYSILENSGMVPKFEILHRDEIQKGNIGKPNTYPLWIRDFSSGSTSGKGALEIKSIDEAQAWITINSNIDRFMITEYLSGGNYACHLLYHNNKLIKTGSYERLEYFMKRVSPSGITGNISKGRLINNKKITEVATRAITLICKKINVQMNGIVAVDLKADNDGNPYITEINIRHVAATFAFASAGFNLAEYQLLLAINKPELLDTSIEKEYPVNNMILRDIDGLPIWIENYREPAIGEAI